MACCSHAEFTDEASNWRGHETLPHMKGGAKYGHCLGCCRDAAGDDRHWSRNRERIDSRPREVLIMHLHKYDPDGPEVPGVSMLELSPGWIAYRDRHSDDEDDEG